MRSQVHREVTMSDVLVLRTCRFDMTSHGGFKWPRRGKVEAPDFKPTKACGNGLHGFLWGEGDAGLADWSADANWLVVKVDSADIIDLGGKVKFPRGSVVCCGDRKKATDYLVSRAPRETACMGAFVTGGDGSTVTGGDGSTVTGGYRSTVTGGYRSTVTGGHRSTVTGGDGSTLSVKWWDGARYRIAVAYVGEDGIKANTPCCVVDGRFEEAR
jgi:hypothetical protein